MKSSKPSLRLELAIDQARVALDQARLQAAELNDRIGPALDDAREKIGPALEDARGRLAPLVDDARGRLSPVVDDARLRLADLSESIATRLEEARADTEAAVPAPEPESGSMLKKLLVVAGVGTAAAVVAQRLKGGSSEPQWQSTNPTSTTPSPTATTSPTSTTTSTTGGPFVTPGPVDAAGGTPGEAMADAVETPHVPTTPDAPVEHIDVRE